MVVSTSVSTGASAESPGDAVLLERAIDASVAPYLAWGDRVGALMDAGWKVFAALGVLLALAWAFGVLPGAVKLF